MKFPFRYFYIGAFLVLPVAVIGIFSFADSINSALYGVPATKDNDVRGVMIAPIILFTFGTQFSPRKMPDFVRIGYRVAKQANFSLKAIRAIWFGTLIISMCIYGLAASYLWFLSPIKNWSVIPNFALIPVTSVISALMYVLTYAIHSAWEKNEHFRLFMARETCKDASTRNERLERVKLLIESVRWYEQYVRLALKVKIANLDNIISILATQSPDEHGRSMSLFYKELASGDELSPLRLLTTIDNTTRTESPTTGERVWNWRNIERVAAIIACIATVIAIFK